MVKKIAKIIGIICATIVALILIFCGILTITEYKPKDIEPVNITQIKDTSGEKSPNVTQGNEMSIMIWNIGYGALGETADFFMDGGNSVYTATEAEVKSNMDAIMNEIEAQNPDIMMLQEVDEKSTRSRKVNEINMICDRFGDYYSSFAYNFKSLYIPYPLPPLGQMASGIMTLSTFEPNEANRVKLPCPFSYPLRLCNLKRCLLISRFPVEGSDKELVIVNVHLEAYDSGEGKIAQTKMLTEILQKEIAAGNYVIAGGDFNQTFSNIDQSLYPNQREGLWKPSLLDVNDFGEDLVCLSDPSSPTCRSLDQPLAGYEGSDFQYYMIDGVIVSSNVEVSSMNTINLGFKHADHNPLMLKATLK